MMVEPSDAVVVTPPNLLPRLGELSDPELNIYALPDPRVTEELLPSLVHSYDRLFVVLGEGGERA